MSTKKKLLALIISAFVVAALTAFVGCGGSSSSSAAASSAASSASQQDPTAEVRQSVEDEFDLLKNLDQNTIDELATAANEDGTMDDLSELGITPEAFIKSLFEGFDYKIQDIQMDGDEAQVTMSVTMKSLATFESASDEMTIELEDEVAADPDKFTNMSEDELMEYVGQKCMDIINELPVQTSDDLTFGYTKTSNGWEPDDGMTEIFTQLLLG